MNLVMKNLLPFLASVSFASLAPAATTMVNANVYAVDQGVTFNISNSGASSYLFSWTDASGTVTNVSDVTLMLTVGETYNFQRTTGSHPFVITDDTLPVSGSDGSYARTTFSGAVIDAATLNPLADFTADPSPTADQISWATGAGDAGSYFYTCRVDGHSGMTGSILIVPEPSSSLLSLAGVLSILWVRRPRRA